MKLLWSILLLSILFSCASKNDIGNRDYKVLKTDIYTLKNPPLVGTTISDQKIYAGGFSGLAFKEKSQGEYVFLSNTDRGPNGFQVDIDRPFLLPEFAPTIYTIKTNSEKKELEISEKLEIKRKNNSPITGLPNIRTEENPVDVFGYMTSLDIDGLDVEGIVLDGEGGYWVSDEYSPSLVHLNSNGKIIKRLTPGAELPKVYNERKPNKGFEGIAKIDNHILGFLQAPLELDKKFNRIVDVDLDSLKTTAEYFYPLDSKSDRLSDAFALADKSILVVEQNGKTGEESYKKVYRIIPQKSDEILSKSLILDLDQTPLKVHGKIEGITAIDKRHLALINDNDFGIGNKTDFKTGKTPLSEEYSELAIIELDQDLY